MGSVDSSDGIVIDTDVSKFGRGDLRNDLDEERKELGFGMTMFLKYTNSFNSRHRDSLEVRDDKVLDRGAFPLGGES
jgi:hypothetical protein